MDSYIERYIRDLNEEGIEFTYSNDILTDVVYLKLIDRRNGVKAIRTTDYWRFKDSLNLTFIIREMVNELLNKRTALI